MGLWPHPAGLLTKAHSQAGPCFSFYGPLDVSALLEEPREGSVFCRTQKWHNPFWSLEPLALLPGVSRSLRALWRSTLSSCCTAPSGASPKPSLTPQGQRRQAAGGGGGRAREKGGCRPVQEVPLHSTQRACPEVCPMESVRLSPREVRIGLQPPSRNCVRSLMDYR